MKKAHCAPKARRVCRSLKIVARVVVLYICLITIVAASVYYTQQDTFFGMQKTTTDWSTAGTTWRNCADTCRAHSECQMFKFRPSAATAALMCELYQSTVGYGSIFFAGSILGGLDSTAPDAKLVWVGNGAWINMFLGGNAMNGPRASAPSLNHSDCQRLCDSLEAQYGTPCASYKLNRGGAAERCFLQSNIVVDSNETKINAHFGIRKDINATKSAIIGDTLQTRLDPNKLPPPPPDIGEAIPKFTEIDFHFEEGLQEWLAFLVHNVTNWHECSVKCHETAECISFVYWVDGGEGDIGKCSLYDAALLGETLPGYDKYGVIDRSGAVGDVKQLVQVRYNEPTRFGYALFWFGNVTTFEKCAKHCYDFYEPKACLGFFYDRPMLKCKLYRSIPYKAVEDKAAFAGRAWNATNYRFGYLNEPSNRIASNIMALLEPKPTSSYCSKRRCPGDVQVFSYEKGAGAGPGVIARQTMQAKKRTACAGACHTAVWCVSLDWDEATKTCRLFEASAVSDIQQGDPNSFFGISGGVHNRLQISQGAEKEQKGGTEKQKKQKKEKAGGGKGA